MAVLLREAIGDTIRRARTRRRRTLRDVSAAARVSLGYLSEIERGRKEPSSELLAAICDALAMTLPDLLDEAADAMRPVRRAPLVDPALRSAVEAALGAADEDDLGVVEEPAAAPAADTDGAQASGVAGRRAADATATSEHEGDTPGAPGTVLLVARMPVATGDRPLVAAA